MKKTVSVVSLNIHRGLSSIRRTDIMHNILNTLESTKADIVCLQEVVREPGANSSPLEEACRNLWRYQCFGQTAAFSGGIQGNCILSRYPIKNIDNLNLTYGARHGRALLRADIAISAKKSPLTVICTHLGLDRIERQQQAHSILSYLKGEVMKLPLVLAGDFNDWQRRLSMMFKEGHDLEEAFKKFTNRHARTFPTYLPCLALDRIYYGGLELIGAKIIRYQRHGFSDHRPIFSQFIY